jgi:DNA-binding transcriptional LysR family regulator
LEGLLRLSSSDWFGTLMLAPVLVEFSRRHPRVWFCCKRGEECGWGSSA